MTWKLHDSPWRSKPRPKAEFLRLIIILVKVPRFLHLLQPTLANIWNYKCSLANLLCTKNRSTSHSSAINKNGLKSPFLQLFFFFFFSLFILLIYWGDDQGTQVLSLGLSASKNDLDNVTWYKFYIIICLVTKFILQNIFSSKFLPYFDWTLKNI